MSHEVDTMAYAGQAPWHGLGTYVGESDVSSAEMIRAAGLEWSVSKRPLLIPTGPCDPEARELLGTPVPGMFVTVRDDRGTVLGQVGDSYTPFENAEAFAFMDELLGFDGVRYHTAGALMGGRKVWALVQVGQNVAIRRLDGSEDALGRFLLISFGHDGHTPVTIQTTSVRVVCWNTLSAALGDKSNQLKIYHTSGIKQKMEEVREALGISIAYFDELVTVGQELENTGMRRDEFRSFADRLLLETDQSIQAAKERLGKTAAKNHQERVFELETCFTRGLGNRGETRWDAINAVTEWVDHKRAQARHAVEEIEKRSRALDSAWFGEGARTKSRALRMLRK